jgi:hypothetical protein
MDFGNDPALAIAGLFDGAASPAGAPAAPVAYSHPPEDYIPMEPAPSKDGEPLETYEADPADDREPAPEPDDATMDYIRLAAGLYASDAAQAFTERRLALQRRHGALATTDLSNPPYALALALHERAQAILEGLGGRNPPDPATIDASLTRLATLGALAFSLHDKLSSEIRISAGQERGA